MLTDDFFNIWRDASAIPELGGGGSSIAPTLVELASVAKRDECIIDIGPFLGSTTGWLALGSYSLGHNAPIHSFDTWAYDDDLQKRAWKQRKISLPRDESFWRLWAANVAHLPVDITPHVGDVYAGDPWDGPTIGLLVDDASSGHDRLDAMWARFKGSVRRGTPLVMMDYYFHLTHDRRDVLETVDWFYSRKNQFDGPYPIDGKRNPAAIFYYTGGAA